MKKAFWVSLMTLGLILTATVGAQAETVTRPLEVKSRDRATTVGERVADRCSEVENRLDARIEQFNTTKGRHVLQYQKLKEEFQRTITLLQGKGYDTTKLQADAKVLDEKVITFSKDYKAFIDQLAKARLQSCGTSEGAFQTEMSQAVALLKVVQQDSQDIRQYYQTVIRADIKALRQQK